MNVTAPSKKIPPRVDNALDNFGHNISGRCMEDREHLNSNSFSSSTLFCQRYIDVGTRTAPEPSERCTVGNGSEACGKGEMCLAPTGHCDRP